MEKMTLEEFNRFADGDRVPLMAGLEILLQNGRQMMRSQSPRELVPICLSGMGNFVAEEEVRKIVDICLKLAALDTPTLLGYIRRGNLELKAPGAEEAGVCPICEGKLDYEDDIHTDDGGFYCWKCCGCGATGKEGYDKVFDQHYDVVDGDGNHYPAVQ